MTAITGLIAAGPSAKSLAGLAGDMAARVKGRGAERFAAFVPPEGGIALGARANPTLDLTPDGRQPANSADKHLVVALDGYIANGGALRRELEDKGIKPRGHSDAELLAEAVNHWGLNRLLQKLEGGFAFALWDNTAKTLHLVRDRMGLKPLYVMRTAAATAFASDVAAFKALPDYAFRLNTDAVAACLATGHLHTSQTLNENVMALPAGHRLMLRADDTTLRASEAWWSPAATMEEIALRSPHNNDTQERLEHLRATLASEAARLDVAFALFDTGSAEAKRLEAALEKSSEKTFKTIGLKTPDAAALQTAFDALTKLPQPVCDPIAINWQHALATTADTPPVLLAPTECAFTQIAPNAPNALTRLPKPVLRLLAPVLPDRFAQLGLEGTALYKTDTTLWDTAKLLDKPFDADYRSPRMDMTPESKRAYFAMNYRLIQGQLPMLDMIAGTMGLELRTPWADHRAMEFHLPAPWKTDADTAAWLRGPLRIRMQNAVSSRMAEKLGITNKAPLDAAWQAFLNGDNTQSRKLWAYLSLAAWADAALT